MAVRALTEDALKIITRVITESIRAQARYDAEDGRAPSRQDLVYVTEYSRTKERLAG